jgi:release factor glutamine methyltransferase
LNPKVDPKYEKDINLAIDRLKNWEPIEYIINNAEFYSLDFYVTSDTLIPRNDTEIMVDKTIEEVVTIP